MKKTILWSVIGVLAIVTAVLLYNALSSEFEPAATPENTLPTENTEVQNEEKETAPTPDYRDFTVYTYEGEEVTLSQVASEGKAVVINFWTTWCGYCMNEMPYFNETYKKYSDRVNFMMIDVNGEGNDSMEEARAYIESQGFEFPVYYDTALSATYAYGVGSYPTTVIIDPNGQTIYAYPGMMSEQNLISYIDYALN